MPRIFIAIFTAALLAGLGCEIDPNAIEPEGHYSPTSLYARIGGERVLRRLVDNYFDQALTDSKLNFTRVGTPHAWEPNPGNVARLKDKYFSYLSSATGGPAKYEGKAISTAHESLQITPEQFGESISLFKIAAERAGIGPHERAELLTILHHERPAVLGKNAIPATQPARPRGIAGQ